MASTAQTESPSGSNRLKVCLIFSPSIETEFLGRAHGAYIHTPHKASETRQLPSCISTGRISRAGYLIYAMGFKAGGRGRGLPHPPRPRQAAVRSSKVNIVATSIRNQTNSADLTVLVIQNFNVHPDGRNKDRSFSLFLERKIRSPVQPSALGRDFIGDVNAHALNGIAPFGW